MSLTTDDIEDIKQIVVANNATLMAEFDEKLDQKLDEKLEEKLDQKLDEKLAPIKQQLDDLTNFVTDTFDSINEQTGHQLADHESRITKLEQSPTVT